MESVMRRAQDKGRVRTHLGRRCRFNLWEPRHFGVHKALPKEEAEREHGPNMIKRAFTYKALNKLIQGSAADMTKKAMVDLYKEGIIPHIQVHDELDISVKDDIAVLSIGSKGIALYDVSDIQNPKAKGIFDVGYTYKTEFWNGQILICTRSGLKTAKINS